ncbi:MAG: hypothetical protein HWE34_02940 [Methylocystaceae bacterium]|nr:hypothetical protein [Methylocystaceae bacterium]
MKKSLIIVAVFLALFISISVLIISSSDDVSKEEGFLYSAIGCTSVYKKLEQPEKTETMLNLINNFSAKNDIHKIHPGYLTRFIKLVEKKWEKENDVARKNCDGIFAMAEKEPKPAEYNDVAKSVIQYLWDLESRHHKKPKLPTDAQ